MQVEQTPKVHLNVVQPAYAPAAVPDLEEWPCYGKEWSDQDVICSGGYDTSMLDPQGRKGGWRAACAYRTSCRVEQKGAEALTAPAPPTAFAPPASEAARTRYEENRERQRAQWAAEAAAPTPAPKPTIFDVAARMAAAQPAAIPMPPIFPTQVVGTPPAPRPAAWAPKPPVRAPEIQTGFFRRFGEVAARTAENVRPIFAPTPQGPVQVYPATGQGAATRWELNYSLPPYLSTPEPRHPGESFWRVLAREVVRAMFKALGHSIAHYFDSRPFAYAPAAAA